MATVTATRTAQNVLAAQFVVNLGTDAMLNTSGVLTNFKATSGVFDIINMPINAQVVGGDIAVETVSDETGTATISLGDSSSATRYANAVNLKAAARTALTITGFRNTSGLNLRMTLANQNGNAAAGVVVITVLYVIEGRACEVYPV